MTVVKALEKFAFGRTEKCVRINSVSSGLAEEDIKVILKSSVLPTSLMLPKVETVEEVRWVSKWIYDTVSVLDDDLRVQSYISMLAQLQSSPEVNGTNIPLS